MNHGDKQAMLELITDQLGRHWEQTDTHADRVYGIDDNDDYGRKLVKQAVNYVLNEHHRPDQFNFDDTTAYRYGWVTQGVLAIISMHLVEERETYGLSEYMVERARKLMDHVMDCNIPCSLLRLGATL